MREILLVDGNGNPVFRDGRGGNLANRVDDAGVIGLTACAEDEKSVLNIEQNLTVHKNHSLKLIKT